MSRYAVQIQHRTRPGQRQRVAEIWQRHMAPAVTDNPGHEAYFYCFGGEPDSIVAFQVYTDENAARRFLETEAYARYVEAVSELLEGAPVVSTLEVIWSKAAAR